MPQSDTARPDPEFRFGFVLTTAAGNATRYLNLRKYAERDPDVECVWAPVSHYLDPNPFRRLPGPVQTRLVVARQAAPVTAQLSRLDAVMYHVFEPYVRAILRGLVQRRPLTVWSQDNPPYSGDPDHPQSLYLTHVRGRSRTRIRFLFDRWCLRRTPLSFPFSTWGRDVLVQECGLAPDTVHPIHVGLDLELWPHRPADQNRAARPNILFVGGDFERKGGPALIDVFARCFAAQADLHLVTRQPPANLPPNTTVYTDMVPNDPRLRKLYADCDLFVLPTLADMSSWVALEAMATGRPVIISGSGGIPDLVKEGETGFLIETNNIEMLQDRMAILLNHPELRLKMGEAGRKFVEIRFSAETNVACILEIMKQAVNQTRR